ncbi:hypothetical protein GQX74_011059 [Glossina fuscipes]|nr:hypothetical protein GQX74_011059 [Glossina fuscipes]
MKKLKDLKLDVPPPAKVNKFPTKPLEEFIEADIEKKIGRRRSEYTGTEKQVINDVILRQEQNAIEVQSNVSYETSECATAEFITKNAYRAHQEDSQSTEILWKFDFGTSKFKVKTYTLRFEMKTFGEGNVELLIHPCDEIAVTDIENCTRFEICAKLSGGKGDVAWQHKQLFRQSLNSKNYPFDLQVELL